jgi:hypothetical protein
VDSEGIFTGDWTGEYIFDDELDMDEVVCGQKNMTPSNLSRAEII